MHTIMIIDSVVYLFTEESHFALKIIQIIAWASYGKICQSKFYGRALVMSCHAYMWAPVYYEYGTLMYIHM